MKSSFEVGEYRLRDSEADSHLLDIVLVRDIFHQVQKVLLCENWSQKISDEVR